MTSQDHPGRGESIGDRIRGIRTERGLSQRQLAARIDPPTSQANVARWESGALFDKCRRELERIATALGTTAEELFGGRT
jgi:transcriptional regulator with XRE-family HTH domain